MLDFDSESGSEETRTSLHKNHHYETEELNNIFLYAYEQGIFNRPFISEETSTDRQKDNLFLTLFTQGYINNKLFNDNPRASLDKRLQKILEKSVAKASIAARQTAPRVSLNLEQALLPGAITSLMSTTFDRWKAFDKKTNLKEEIKEIFFEAVTDRPMGEFWPQSLKQQALLKIPFMDSFDGYVIELLGRLHSKSSEIAEFIHTLLHLGRRAILKELEKGAPLNPNMAQWLSTFFLNWMTQQPSLDQPDHYLESQQVLANIFSWGMASPWFDKPFNDLDYKLWYETGAGVVNCHSGYEQILNQQYFNILVSTLVNIEKGSLECQSDLSELIKNLKIEEEDSIWTVEKHLQLKINNFFRDLVSNQILFHDTNEEYSSREGITSTLQQKNGFGAATHHFLNRFISTYEKDPNPSLIEYARILHFAFRFEAPNLELTQKFYQSAVIALTEGEKPFFSRPFNIDAYYFNPSRSFAGELNNWHLQKISAAHQETRIKDQVNQDLETKIQKQKIDKQILKTEVKGLKEQKKQSEAELKKLKKKLEKKMRELSEVNEKVTSLETQIAPSSPSGSRKGIFHRKSNPKLSVDSDLLRPTDTTQRRTRSAGNLLDSPNSSPSFGKKKASKEFKLPIT